MGVSRPVWRPLQKCRGEMSVGFKVLAVEMKRGRWIQEIV